MRHTLRKRYGIQDTYLGHSPWLSVHEEGRAEGTHDQGSDIGIEWHLDILEDVREDQSGMKGIHCHFRPIESPGQFVRKKDVSKLALSVSRPRHAIAVVIK